MKTNKIIATLATVAALSGSLVAYAQSNRPQDGQPARRHERKERHPEIRHAMMALGRAKGFLQHADRDFGGHRAKAEEYVEKALQECREALKADRQ
jgi:hypothetical protein